MPGPKQKAKKVCSKFITSTGCTNENCPFPHVVEAKVAEHERVANHKARNAPRPPSTSSVVYDGIKRPCIKNSKMSKPVVTGIQEDEILPNGTIIRTCKRHGNTHTFEIAIEINIWYKDCESCRGMRKL